VKACVLGNKCHKHSYEEGGKKPPAYVNRYKKKVLKDKTLKHNGIVYYANKTDNGVLTVSRSDFQLNYGSANL
jgi:hypothetical protein